MVRGRIVYTLVALMAALPPKCGMAISAPLPAARLPVARVATNTVAILADAASRHLFVLSSGPTLPTQDPAGPGTLAALDLSTGTTALSLAVGLAPVALAVDPVTDHLLTIDAGVAGRADGDGRLLDARTGAPLRVLILPGTPKAVAALPGGRFLVACAGVGEEDPSTLVLIDARTGGLLHSWAGGIGPRAIGVDRRTGRAWVANAGPPPGSPAWRGHDLASVSILDPVRGARTLPIPQPPPPPVASGTPIFPLGASQLVIDEPRRRVFVAATDAEMANPPGEIVALDADSGRVLVRRTVDPLAAMALDTEGGRLVVTHPFLGSYSSPAPDSGAISLLDGATLKGVESHPRGTPGAVAVDPTARRAYVLTGHFSRYQPTGPGDVLAIDLRSGRLVGDVQVCPLPSAIALVPAPMHTFLICSGRSLSGTGPDLVYVLDRRN